MKKIVLVSGLIAVLFALNYAIDRTLSPKPLWLDVAVHTSGGQLAALLCGFAGENFLLFRESRNGYKFLLMVAGGLSLGVLVEVLEMLDSLVNILPMPVEDASYWNLVQDVVMDFLGAIMGAFTYFSINHGRKE